MGIVERHTSTADLTHWRGQIPVDYVYTAGRAGERFFREMINGRLLAAECKACGRVYLPARTYCERCFGRIEENFTALAAAGKVHTYTVCHRKSDGTPLDPPAIIAVIAIDGADDGFVHYLGELEPEDVHIGLSVRAVFVPKKQRKGAMSDIRYFRPIK